MEANFSALIIYINMNRDEEAKNLSLVDIFSQCQETLDEAKKKNQAESSTRAQYLRLSKDGIYNVRILPLAPVIDADGNVIPPERKGYEYPSKEYVCKINTGKTDKKGKEVVQFVNICNVRMVYPDLKNDLLELYVSTACELYADDEKLCKTIKSSSFNGGLKYDAKRCMYVLDMDKRDDGLMILQLSFAQYKELENRKLKLWSKLAKRGAVPCPISSPTDAFPIEIERKNDNGKTSYEFTIDQTGGQDQLSDAELQALLDAPRLPEALYKYSRYHLEATVVFLKQMDERFGIKVMKEEAIQDCIDQIKLKLPADDQSHFTIKGESDGDSNDAGTTTLDDLYKIYDSLEAAGKSDRSEEGADLRTQIREFIEAKELDVKVSRTKSNLDLLQEIEDILDDDDSKGDDDDDETPVPAPKRKSAPVEEDNDDDDDDGVAAKDPSENEGDDDEDEAPRRSRNDDTNEPAARLRRTARPARRR